LAGGGIDGPVADAQGADARRRGGRGFHAARFQKDLGGFRRPSGLEGVHVGMVSLRGQRLEAIWDEPREGEERAWREMLEISRRPG
jgi:hypothetical protein